METILLNVCVICKLNYYSVPSKPIKFSSSAAYSIVVMILSVADLRGGGGAGGRPPPLFWVKKEEMTEGKIANRAVNQDRSPPSPTPLGSRSGSATVYCMYMQVTEFFSTQKSMDQLCDLSVG